MIKLATVELRKRVEAANNVNAEIYLNIIESTDVILEEKVLELAEISKYMRTDDYKNMPAMIQNIIIDKHVELEQKLIMYNAKRNKYYNFLTEVLAAVENKKE